jgi:hypothetical protein
MSFDALLTIIFILFFVIGPLLRRMSGGGQPQRRTPPGRPSSGRPAADSRSEPEGPLSRRLEEARRRVQEAMGEHEAGPSEARRRPAGQPARELDWQPAPTPLPASIPAERQPPQQRAAATQPVSPTLSAERRRQARPPAKLRLGRRPSTSKDGIVNGVIWHEILSEPVSRRGIRRQTSRLRSR